MTEVIGSFCPICGSQVQGSGHCINCDTDPEFVISVIQVNGVMSLEIPEEIIEKINT